MPKSRAFLQGKKKFLSSATSYNYYLSLPSSTNTSATYTSAWPALKQAKLTITDHLNTYPLLPSPQSMDTFFNLNKTKAILKLRPAQRNSAEFHKYRSKKKEYLTHYKNRGKNSYTKTDNIMIPDLAMLLATAKRSVEVSVVFAKFESLQKFSLTIHSAAIRLCICPTVPSPASWAKWPCQLGLWIYWWVWGAGMF